jgi:hypothetical protein
MSKYLIAFMFIFLLATGGWSVTLKDIPFDSSFHIGLTSGLGLGIDFGVEVEFPLSGFILGIEVEQLVTNINYEQNVNTAKFGLMKRFNLMSDLYLTLHLGFASFYLPKPVDYIDLYTGTTYSLPGDHQGRLAYWGMGVNYLLGEYIITPKMTFNTVDGGGTLLSFDVNIGHEL